MRRIMAALCVLFLLAGCVKPPEAPKQADPSQVGPSPVVTPQPEPVPATEVTQCLDRAPSGPSGLVHELQGISVVAGICRVKAHADPLTVSFFFPPEVDEQLARDSLKGGFRNVTFQRQKEKSWVIVEIPEGLVGETTVIRLQGPVGPGGALFAVDLRAWRVGSATKL